MTGCIEVSGLALYSVLTIWGALALYIANREFNNPSKQPAGILILIGSFIGSVVGGLSFLTLLYDYVIPLLPCVVIV